MLNFFFAGPPEKDKEFYDIEEEGRPIHHSFRGTARQNHMVELERWEDAVVSNIGYTRYILNSKRNAYFSLLI